MFCIHQTKQQQQQQQQNVKVTHIRDLVVHVLYGDNFVVSLTW